MQRPIPWPWIALIAGLLLLPGSFGRFLLQLLGGVTLALLALPLMAGAAALIGWQVLKRRLRTCPTCGFSSLGTGDCPACGSPFSASQRDGAVDLSSGEPDEMDVSKLTINVDAVDVDALPLQSTDQNTSQRKG